MVVEMNWGLHRAIRFRAAVFERLHCDAGNFFFEVPIEHAYAPDVGSVGGARNRERGNDVNKKTARFFQTNSSRVGNEDVKKACQILQKCQEIVDKLALFSRNEEKDDISTGDLKYLLIPYYLGDLIEKLETEDRIQLIRVSKGQLLSFI